MKAFVLAGGAGTRLSPLTTYIPKGMIPIGGKPFIDYVISYLAQHGIRNIVMLLSEDDSEVLPKPSRRRVEIRGQDWVQHRPQDGNGFSDQGRR